MKSKLISLLCALAITAGAFFAAAMLPSGQAVFAAANQTERIASASSSQADETGYIIKSYEGKIGVFKEGSSTPDQIIDFKTESLPKAAQDKLAAGIRVKNRDELLALLENYTS